MALKRATFYTYGSDSLCAETKKYIEDSGVLLTVRDLENKPFTIDELKKIIGYLDPKHFVNPAGTGYKQHKLENGLPPRDELIELIAADLTLLKKPIIRTARLMTVGCDKRKISEMLQLSMNSNDNQVEEGKGNVIRQNHRRDDNRKRESVSGK